MGPSSPYKRDNDYESLNDSGTTVRRKKLTGSVKLPIKGKFGESTKVVEEFHEWVDANSDGYKVLEQVELVDLVGAIIGYAQKKFNVSPEELLKEAKAKNRTMAAK